MDNSSAVFLFSARAMGAPTSLGVGVGAGTLELLLLVEEHLDAQSCHH